MHLHSARKLLFFVLIQPVLFSCSSLYIKNRGRDLADVATLEVSRNYYGFSLRAGPFKAGLSYKSPSSASAGLRGGEFGIFHTAEFTAVLFGADYFSELPLQDLLPPPPVTEKESAGNETKDKPGDVAADENVDNNIDENSDESTTSKASPPSPPASPLDESLTLLSKRGKSFRARSPFGTTISLLQKENLLKGRRIRKEGDFAPPYYYTQIEISLGLYAGIRIGLNPGELLDFIAGIFTLDPFHDDAPYAKGIKGIEDSPYWNLLDDATKEKIRSGKLKLPVPDD